MAKQPNIEFLERIKKGLENRIKNQRSTNVLASIKNDEADIKIIDNLIQDLKEVAYYGGHKTVLELAKVGAKGEKLF